MIWNWLRRARTARSSPSSSSKPGARNHLHGPELLEDRTVPAGSIVVAADAGAPPEVRVYDYETAGLRSQFLAYDGSVLSGVRVASGDVNGDGFDDLITVPGPGSAPHVKIFDGINGSLIGSFFAYDANFQGGVFLASGDVDGDGLDDIITGTGPGGGPHVKVFRADTTLIGSFFAYTPLYSGGVRVAAGDVNGDGRAEVITGVGFGGGPHVQAFDLSSGSAQILSSFFAYQPQVTTGIFVTAGDIDADGRAEIITGAAAGAAPHVQAFDAAGNSKLSFFAFDAAFLGGVRVDAADVNRDGRAEIATATGYGVQPVTIVYNGAAVPLQVVSAFSSDFRIGIYTALSETPLNIPSTPSDVIQAAYANLANRVRANQPVIFIQQNNFLNPYPYGLYGFGFGVFYPTFYDAPGLYYDPGYFYAPGYFVEDVYVEPVIVDPYGSDSYYYDPYYFDDGGYYFDDGGYYDGGYYDGGFSDFGY